MYLKEINIQNLGPVSQFVQQMPFEDGKPVPVCLVGKNGTGKSTVLSVIVNALSVAKGLAFEDSEIEKGKVYRVRSAHFIRHGTDFYSSYLEFENGISVEEIKLDRTKKEFEEQLQYCPIVRSWAQIGQDDADFFGLKPIPNQQPTLKKIEIAFDSNCVLFFPPNRFEEPAWLNELNLNPNLRPEERRNVKGFSDRLIFSEKRVAMISNWVYSVVLQHLASERIRVPVIQNGQAVSMFQSHDGPNSKLINALCQIANLIFVEKAVQLSLSVGDKRARTLGFSGRNLDGEPFSINNVFSFSSGESALFAMFATILHDFDKTNAGFSSLEEVKGIVVIDEIASHLHVGLQRTAIPKLIRLFPNVQFLITTHSPLFLLGMEQEFGPNGVRILNLPSGQRITAESFEEFDAAFSTFQQTAKFQDELASLASPTNRPLVLTEGRSDVLILETAWEKLYDAPRPFDIKPSGIEPNEGERNGGADSLRRSLEFLATVSDRKIIGLFDNDRAGNEQFKGLHKVAFEPWAIGSGARKHKSKEAWGCLLPIPEGRNVFVTSDNFGQRYLAIEHYFSDHILTSNNLKGEAILGTEVFEIRERKKMEFANQIRNLDVADFQEFGKIFDQFKLLCEAFAIAEPADEIDAATLV